MDEAGYSQINHPVNRYVALLGCFLQMLCLGGVYAWSLYVPGMREELGMCTRDTQLIIGSTIGIFALSLLYTGRLERIAGSRLLSFLSAILLFVGYQLASLLGSSFLLLFVFLSVFVGVGTACGYAACLAVPARLFPERRGLAVGISVSGFGGGAILHSYIFQSLLTLHTDYGVRDVWSWVGIVYGIIGLSVFYFIHSPIAKQELKSTAVKATLNWLDKRFILLFSIMFFGSVAGILLVSNLSPLATSLGFEKATAALSVSMYALGNLGGRVFWGWMSDRIGTTRTLTAAYLLLVVGVLMIITTHVTSIFLVAVFLSASGYSSSFSVFPIKTSKWFGSENFGTIYPRVFLGYGIAGFVGPAVAGELFDISRSYTYALILAVACGITALLLNNLSIGHQKAQR